MRYLFIASLIGFMAIGFGCSVSTRIVEEYDVVDSLKRVFLNHTGRPQSLRSSLLYVDQTFVKEIHSPDKAVYKVFDIIVLTSHTFRLEERVYIIVDSTAFQLKPERTEYDHLKSINENRSDILTADSTSVSVVTGYSENDRKVARFTYKLSAEIVDKIMIGNEVSFRYYAGPGMFTVKLKSPVLASLKKMIELK